MSKNTLKVISKSIAGKGQTTDYNEVIELVDPEDSDRKFRCRVTIHTDSYVEQSRVRIQVWSEGELKWNLVHTIDPKVMKTEAKLGYTPDAHAGKLGHKHYQADRNELIRVAKKVLGLS